MGRLQELVKNVPPISLVIISLCVIIEVCVFLFDVDLYEYTMNPRAVLYLQEYYRIISSAFFHTGLMHIGMNMMSMAAVGISLEASIGSFNILLFILWTVFLEGLIYCAISWVAWWLTGQFSWMTQNAVGFSGVLFGLAVVESYKATSPTRSLFGMFTVPTRVYPWVLMVVLQVMVPQISFLGHLSGLLCGILYSYGCLNVVMPSTAFIKNMETWSSLSLLTKHPAFKKCPDDVALESIRYARTAGPPQSQSHHSGYSSVGV